MMDENKEIKLTYPLICDAVKGDPKAQTAILAYYDDYINSLATVEETTEDGTTVSYIDEDIKTEIQMRLLSATKKWRAV